MTLPHMDGDGVHKLVLTLVVTALTLQRLV